MRTYTVPLTILCFTHQKAVKAKMLCYYILHLFMMYVNTFYDVKCILLYMIRNENIDIKKEVGSRIKESRKCTNMTQAEVAKLLRMTQQQYSRFENGVFELSYSVLIQICKLFDVSADYILGLDD